MKAEALILGLKHSIDEIFGNHLRGTSVQALEYAPKPCGTMQYEELKTAIGMLESLKEQLDFMAAECCHLTP